MFCDFVHPRGDSVSASQDGVKYSATRDFGPAAAAVYDSAPPDQPDSPALHSDAYTPADPLDEGGECSPVPLTPPCSVKRSSHSC